MSDGLVVMISGAGSNLHAILETPVGEYVRAVISDYPDAGGLKFAERAGLPTHICPPGEGMEAAITESIAKYDPQIIVLAGFMRVLGPDFIAAHRGKMVNIHPSLLPKFPGLNTHRRVIEAREREHGCTVHWVNEKVDGGDIIDQAALIIKPGETEHFLKSRVQQLEHRLYPRVLAKLLGLDTSDWALEGR